jgi:protein phosphatase
MAAAEERIAVISDVHGNLTALEAVLDHIRESGITRIFNLGDMIGKGPRSAEVVDRCRAVSEVIVLGNWEVEMAAGFARTWPAGEWHRAQLGAERLDYLAALPGCFDFTLSGRAARLFHASQRGVHHRVYEAGPREQHDAMFSNTDFTGFAGAPQIVGYGDIHMPYMRELDGRTLFNAGSVGNPLDVPLACYAVLEGRFGSDALHPWSIRFVRLPYDIEAEIAAAEASGMPDLEAYARELRTAVYRGRKAAVELTRTGDSPERLF